MSDLQHNTDGLFEHGQYVQVALLLFQSGLADPVFGKLLGHRWQP